MAFESLTDKLQNIFKNLRGKGKLSEEDVKLITGLKGCVGYASDPDTRTF